MISSIENVSLKDIQRKLSDYIKHLSDAATQGCS